MYRVFTNFRLELIEPSAREVEGQQFFLVLTLFRVSLGLSQILLSSLAPRSSFSTRFHKINFSLVDSSLRKLAVYQP